MPDLRGEKPADLPVMQASKFDQSEGLPVMGFEVPGALLTIADELIERRLLCCGA